MPNVPNVPGVPALSSYSAIQPALLTFDAALVISRALQPQWGIYLDGTPIIASSLASMLGAGSILSSLNSVSSLFGVAAVQGQYSVVDFDYKKDWSISDYPVEQGAFQSYDKVEMPFDVRMRVAAGGSEANRKAMLETAEAAARTLDLYDVVTPEKTYSNCNINHVDYKRASSRGVGLLILDIWLVEVRQTATSAFSNTQQPGEAAPQGLGNVQPKTPSTSIQQNFQSGGWAVM